jgi:hypothetical protein
VYPARLWPRSVHCETVTWNDVSGKFALSFVHVDSANNKITRNAYPVTIADRSFFRSDLRSGDKALSLFATWYRGYAVIAWASANSPQDLEDAANALSALSFGED